MGGGTARQRLAGRSAGRLAGGKKLEIAGNMIRGGVDDQTIVICTGLSVEAVADLKRKLNGAG